jgi:hypothetical protein
MATRPPPKQQPLAFVEIGIVDLLMPLPKALQLVELLQHAVTCRQHYCEREQQYIAGESVKTSLASVRPEQVIAPAQPITPRSQRQAPLRLTGD